VKVDDGARGVNGWGIFGGGGGKGDCSKGRSCNARELIGARGVECRG